MTFVDDLDASEPTNHDAIRNRNSAVINSPTRIRPGTETRLEKLCPKCGRWIGLGLKGHLHPFSIHLDGERCRRKAVELQMEEAHRLPVASTSFIPGPEPPPMLVAPLISSHPRILVSNPPFDFHPYGPSESSYTQPIFPCSDVPTTNTSPSLSPLMLLPPVVFPEQMPSISPDLPPPPQEQAFCPTFPTMAKVPCCGVWFKWECNHLSKTYPFQYHDTDNPTWSAMTRRPPDPDVIYLQSFSCTLFHDASTEACFECLKVPSSDKFQSLVLKASRDPAPTVPWGYLSWDQVVKRLRDRTEECWQYHKKVSFISSLST